METKIKNLPVADADFEPEFVAGLVEMFEQRITFNQTLGLKVEAVGRSEVACSIQMRPALVGHFSYNRLHGGVISAMLDATAGLAVLTALAARHLDKPVAERWVEFERLGTIDLRVDYLKQAIGDRFVGRANVLRLGGRVASTRMEFLSDTGELLCAGAASYIVT